MATTLTATRAAEARTVHPVPNPFPLTMAGMLAALGPQAINFGISIGGGFWAVVTIATFAWPAWMGGAVIAAHRFTGIGNPLPFGPPHYLWVLASLSLRPRRTRRGTAQGRRGARRS